MPQPQGDNLPSVYPGDVELQASPRPRHRRCQFLGERLRQLLGSFTSCLRGIPRCLCILVMLLIPVGIVGGFVLLLVWLGMFASKPGVYVSNAFLTDFNLTRVANPQSYNLDYNLTVDIGLRNSNPRHTLCYRGIESSAYYDGQRLTWIVLPGFCQNSKTSSTVTAVFVGRTTVELEPSMVGFLENEMKTGSLAMEVSVNGDIRARLETVKWKYRTGLNHVCKMDVPLIVNGTSTSRAAFSAVDCVDMNPRSPPR